MPKQTFDVSVENHGSIFLFRLLTVKARGWVSDNVYEPMWYGAALAVEHGYARELADGMLTDGLRVH